MPPEHSKEDKTEPATPYRREEFRKQGKVALSRELVSVLLLATVGCTIYYSGGNLLQEFTALTHKVFKFEEISDLASCFVSIYSNAGLPNEFGEYDETPEQMFKILSEYAKNKTFNIVGGCCGTTHHHIRAFSEISKLFKPRIPKEKSKLLSLSGLEPLVVRPESNFINIGERMISYYLPVPFFFYDNMAPLSLKEQNNGNLYPIKSILSASA